MSIALRPLFCAAQGTSPNPPALEEKGIGVLLRDGARSRYNDTIFDVLPIGDRDFLYVGQFMSYSKDPCLSIGDSKFKGYTGDTWVPKSHYIPVELCGYVVCMTAEGHVKWYFAQRDGHLLDLRAVVVGEDTYVVMCVRPSNRSKREVNDDVVTVWYNQKGEEWKITKQFTHAAPSAFDAQEYLFWVKLSADGGVKEYSEPIQLKVLKEASKNYQWLYLYSCTAREGKLRIIGGLSNATITVGEGHGAQEITSSSGAGVVKDLLFVETDGKSCSRLEMLKAEGIPLERQQVLASLDCREGTFLSCYFQRGISSASGDKYSLFGTPFPVPAVDGVNILFKVNADWTSIEWQRPFAMGIDVQALAEYGDSLYVTGAFLREHTWGSSTLEEWWGCMNTNAYWGSIAKRDGALGHARAIKSGYAEGRGIAADEGRVYLSFAYQDDYRKAERPEFCAVDFGNGCVYSFVHQFEPCVGFATYTRETGDFITYSPLVFSQYPDLHSSGPTLSGDRTHFATVCQSNYSYGLPSFGISVFGEPMRWDNSYWCYVQLIQTARIRCALSVKAHEGGMLSVSYVEDGEEKSVAVEGKTDVVSVPYNVEVTLRVVPKASYRGAMAVGGGAAEEVSEKTILMKNDATVEVTFKKDSQSPAPTYRLSIAAGVNGTIRVARDSKEGAELKDQAEVRKDDKLFIEAIPAEGYEVATLKVNGQPHTNGTVYTVQDKDVLVEATFSVKPITPVEVVEAKPLRLAPNPASQFVEVHGLAGDARVRVFNLGGQQVLEATLREGQRVDIRTLPIGVYFVQAGSRRARLVVAR